MPGEGVEPSLPCGNWILSPARLPIPPSGQKGMGCWNNGVLESRLWLGGPMWQGGKEWKECNETWIRCLLRSRCQYRQGSGQGLRRGLFDSGSSRKTIGSRRLGSLSQESGSFAKIIGELKPFPDGLRIHIGRNSTRTPFQLVRQFPLFIRRAHLDVRYHLMTSKSRSFVTRGHPWMETAIPPHTA